MSPDLYAGMPGALELLAIVTAVAALAAAATLSRY